VIDGLVVTAFSVVELGTDIGGEPRDRIAPAATADHMAPLGALMRSVQIAGTLERIKELSVRYASERTQFGTALSRFQAVQRHLVVVSAEAEAADAAASLALARPTFENIAAAKIRCGEAAAAAAAAAHQIHGAIGLAGEHDLPHLTRRLWAWRDDFGGEVEWAVALGRGVAASNEPIWHQLGETL
jgi:acyl-CoA dehydrogenase